MSAFAAASAGGALVLVLELLGSRLLAPYFGATIYVWSALISVTLASLAAGYAAGGAWADRAGTTERRWEALGALFACAGAWLLAMCWLRRPLILGAAALGVRGGALASAAALFGPPLACLGAIGPFCVRLRADALERVGREVGGVYAVSTAGSVAGALAAGFWLIPSFRSGALLAVLSAGCWASAAACLWGRRRAAGAACAALALAAGARAAWGARPGPGVVFHESSFYGELKVIDRPERNTRTLYIDALPNTIADLKTLEGVPQYLMSFELLCWMRPEADRGLLIGLGGGSLVGVWKRCGVAADVVEIDEKVVRAARDWFAWRPTGDLFLEDGRRFLERPGRAYDFIVIDAFNGDQHPSHLFTKEALEAARARLKPEGVLAVNLIGYAKGPRAGLMRAAARTLREVFPRVRVINGSPALDEESYVNITFYASAAPLEFRKDPSRMRMELASYREWTWSKELPAEGGELLTDDRNPVESLSARAFLEIRRFILLSARSALAE